MDIAFLIGRILFGGYFIMSGWNHLAHSANLAGYAASKGVPQAKFGVIVSGIIAALGGLSIAFGYMPAVGVALIVIFLVPVTFFMHAFWKSTDPMDRMNQKIAFQKNVGLIGGALAFLGAAVPWMFSL